MVFLANRGAQLHQTTMSQRLNRISGHFASSQFRSQDSDNDVVVVAACRTAITKARKGGLAKTFVEDMLGHVMKECLVRANISDPSIIGDIVVGSVLGKNGQRANEARIAQFFAGIPNTVPLHTVNRQCSSGLQAVAECAAAIRSGMYDVGLACGVESMSSAVMGWQGDVNSKIFMNQQAKDVLLPMGITSENVVSQFGISREDQDTMAFNSHQRALHATKNGYFQKEIVPYTTTVTDKKTGKESKVVIDKDDGIRAATTREGLAKLKPAFKKGGTTTAGNSSQVSDGAAAVLVMSRRKAKQLGLKSLGVFRSFAVAGVEPNVMGIGPVVAIPKALKLANLRTSDIDLFEINEAFASQATYTVQKLGLDMKKVNVNGGAIALGHPLGCTGARMVSTLLYEMERTNKRYGVISMCIGSGMGAAAVFERE